MLMIIALDNEELKRKIVDKYNNNYEIIQINNKDALMCLSKEYSNAKLIISTNLTGNISFESLIKYIKNINNNIQIIVLTKKLDKVLKEQLLAKEIFNIIEGENPCIEAIEECINNPKVIIYKNEKSLDSNKIIAVTGGKNTGKTIFSIYLAQTISRVYKNKRVVLIDMDYLSPSIQLYISGQKNYSMQDYLKDISNSSMKNKENYETEDKRCKNLKYILNSTFSNIPQDEIIEKIINNLKSIYDYIIVDTSYYYMNKLYKTDYKIIHIIEDNIKGIREYMQDIMYISKENKEKAVLILNMKKRGNKRGTLNIKGWMSTNYFSLLLNIDNMFGYKGKINKVLKDIGIIRFEKIKRKIANKIIKGDGDYEK